MAGETKAQGSLRKAHSILLALLLPVLVSCGQVVFHDFVSLESAVWSSTDTLDYLYDGALDRKSTAGYELSVELRTDASYPYKELTVRVESFCMRSGDIISADTLVCPVYDGEGRRRGSTAGMLYQVSSGPLYVPKGSGDSILFRVTHAMHCGSLSGVHDVGIRLTASSGRGQRQF